MICLVAGGDAAEEEVVDAGDPDPAEDPSGRGAIGITASFVLLNAGYPSQCLPDRTHLLH